MRVRVPLLGTGTAADPYRVDFPTASFFQRDPVAMTAIVDLISEDDPDNPPAPGTAARPVTGDGPILISLPDAAYNQWVGKLRARYPGMPANPGNRPK